MKMYLLHASVYYYVPGEREGEGFIKLFTISKLELTHGWHIWVTTQIFFFSYVLHKIEVNHLVHQTSYLYTFERILMQPLQPSKTCGQAPILLDNVKNSQQHIVRSLQGPLLSISYIFQHFIQCK